MVLGYHVAVEVLLGAIHRSMDLDDHRALVRRDIAVLVRTFDDA